ncbi:RICIN domain-containing protein [Streptacidiphilus neutrinimicus]|uniref:RICIN domain-containing protein n=1 Tax=Streptacidiphilus neutrinimicus TaxID=105420 RepID=UPI0005A73779|nr:hypothetical protein [Streptacidiphilus neutrinimicus]
MLKLGKTKRAIAMTAATVAIAGAATIGLAGSASASNGNYWISGHTYVFVTWSPAAPDECLDDSNTGAGGRDNLRTFTCNSQSYQDWTVVNISNGWAQLENGATHRCLDYSIGDLRTFPCYANSFNGGWQKWALVNRTTAGGGAEQVLKSAINQNDGSNTCIDISAQYGLVGLTCSGARQDYGYQGWTAVDQTPGW